MGIVNSFLKGYAIGSIISETAANSYVNHYEKKATQSYPQISYQYETNGFIIEAGILKKYNYNVAHVIIPDGITEIGEYAFYNHTNLETVAIPNSVTYIGRGAFVGCSNLKVVYASEVLILNNPHAFPSEYYAAVAQYVRQKQFPSQQQISSQQQLVGNANETTNSGSSYYAPTTVQRYYIDKYKKLAANGKEVDWDIVKLTTNDDYPYPCVNEYEQDDFDKKNPASSLQGYIPEISKLLLTYSVSGQNNNDPRCGDIDKLNYWKDYLIKSAQNNDRWCQAFLVIIEERGLFCNCLAEDAVKYRWVDTYKSQLISDAINGNPEAMIAVAWAGLDDTNTDTDKRMLYYETAGSLGYGDGYYLLAEHKRLQKYIQTNEVAVWGDADSCEFNRLYALAAETNNGKTVGWCQYTVAELYEKGECGFPVNIDKAIELCELACRNGCSLAESSLRYYRKKRG